MKKDKEMAVYLKKYRGVCCVVGLLALACTQSEDHSTKPVRPSTSRCKGAPRRDFSASSIPRSTKTQVEDTGRETDTDANSGSDQLEDTSTGTSFVSDSEVSDTSSDWL